MVIDPDAAREKGMAANTLCPSPEPVEAVLAHAEVSSFLVVKPLLGWVGVHDHNGSLTPTIGKVASNFTMGYLGPRKNVATDARPF